MTMLYYSVKLRARLRNIPVLEGIKSSINRHHSLCEALASADWLEGSTEVESYLHTTRDTLV